jgi:hypothetical protein
MCESNLIHNVYSLCDLSVLSFFVLYRVCGGREEKARKRERATKRGVGGGGGSEGVRERGREGEKDPNTDVMSSFS